MKMIEINLFFHTPSGYDGNWFLVKKNICKNICNTLTEVSDWLGGNWKPIDSNRAILYAQSDAPFIDLIDGLVKLSAVYGLWKSWMYIGQKCNNSGVFTVNEPGTFHIGVDTVNQ